MQKIVNSVRVHCKGEGKELEGERCRADLIAKVWRRARDGTTRLGEDT